MRISDLLTSDRGRSLFLPAHGRGKALPLALRRLLNRSPGSWDLPELPDFGGPLEKKGVVFDSQKRFADLLGVDKGWYGVNGATGLLQAAVFSIAKPKQALLMPRNIHRSIIEACVLIDLKPVLFDLPFLADRGHVLPPNRFLLKEVLDTLDRQGQDIAGVVLVNPTYHGYSTDISELIDDLHARNLPVLVDEAHGTYFSFALDQNLPRSAISSGADLVVQSLHKSAPGLTQTAVLWAQGNLVDRSAVENNLSLFQTTSPNALLLASCDAVLNEFFTESGQRKLINRLNESREIYVQLKEQGLPLLETQDPLRLILHTASRGISGLEADAWFLPRGLVAELPEPGSLTFCLGFAPQKGLVNVMKKHWQELTQAYIGKTMPTFSKPPLPLLMTPSVSCAVAWQAKSKTLSLEESVGETSTELIAPYPPGIPMILPGEVLDQTRVDWLIDQHRLWPQQISMEIKVIA